MAALAIPQDGLALLRTPEHGPPLSKSPLPLQVMRLSLAQKTTEEILRSFQNKEKVSLRFGKRVIVQHGKKSHPVFAFPESYPSELYQRSTADENTFYFSGKLSHRLETQHAQKDIARVDEALANLENSLKTFEEQKASNEARIVTDKDELRHLTEASQKGKGYLGQASAIRKDRLLNAINRSSPSSPFLGAGHSPTIGLSSAGRSVPGAVSKEQIRLNAVKIPFLHLLAVEALTPKVLAETIHATKEDCDKLLQKFGKGLGDPSGKQELKDKAYRELNLWKFAYPDSKDRQAAIDRTISAFDRMRISTSDQIWETLLPVTERGKGKGSELSRLKIGQAAVNGATPKLGASKAGSHSVTDTDTEKPAGKAKASTNKAKPRRGPTSCPEKKPTLRKETTKQVRDKDAPRKEKKKVPPNGKFKSSEVIEDSDEELDGADTSIEDTTKPIKRPSTKAKSCTTTQPSKTAAASATTSGKTTVSLSPAQPKAASNLMPSTALKRPRSESTTNKASPRSRTGSSPQKPSPLASSPPTNADDLDHSQSSKPNSLSSSTSSPARSPPPNRARKALPPSKTSESRLPSSGVKRKAEEQSSSVPKRRQLNGTHVARPTTNGINQSHRSHPTTTKTASSSSQRSRTPSSSSASTTTTITTSSTTAPTLANKSSSASSTNTAMTTSVQTADLKSKSRRFKIQYARYQALHAKIINLSEGERDADEVNVLRKMHARIGELKREIWEGWEGGRRKGCV